MTLQYLVGEFSMLMEDVRAAATRESDATEAGRLRRQLECQSPTALGEIAASALLLTDALCWHSLACGDLDSFETQSAVAKRLFEFVVCAQLLGRVQAA